MKAFWYLAIPVFALTVYAYCIFLFCTFAGADITMDYQYFAVLACTLFACGVNYRLSLREHTLILIAVVNTLLIVLVEIVGFASYNEIEGIALHVIAAILFLIPVVGSLYLCRYPIRANAMLLFCEFSVVGTVMFLVFQLGYFEAPARATVLSLVCLALDLFLLSSLRTEAPSARKAEVKKQIERGVILAAVLVCSVFAAGAIVLFALPGTRGALFGAAREVGRFFVFLGNMLERFFGWLMELLPDPPPMEMEVMPAESQPVVDTGEFVAAAEFPDSVKILLIAIVSFVILGLVIFALVKLRRKRLRGAAGKITAVTQEETERRPNLADLFFAFLRRLLFRFVFARRLFALRDTYEGFFVRLSRIAKRKGYGRAPAETPSAYLRRLASLLEEGSGDGPIFLADVAAELDHRLYAPDAQESIRVNRKCAERYLRSARTLK